MFSKQIVNVSSFKLYTIHQPHSRHSFNTQHICINCLWFEINLFYWFQHIATNRNKYTHIEHTKLISLYSRTEWCLCKLNIFDENKNKLTTNYFFDFAAAALNQKRAITLQTFWWHTFSHNCHLQHKKIYRRYLFNLIFFLSSV